MKNLISTLGLESISPLKIYKNTAENVINNVSIENVKLANSIIFDYMMFISYDVYYVIRPNRADGRTYF